MTNPGQPCNYSVTVPAPPTMVMHSLLSLPRGGNYFEGYEVHQAGPNSIQVTRRYVPLWAFVVAIIGFFFFFLGLLALLVRESEIVVATVVEDGAGSRVDVSGVAAHNVASAIQMAVERASGAPAMPPGSPAAAAAGGWTPGQAIDAKVCPECAEMVRAAAKSCRFCGYRFDQEPT